MFSDAPPSLLDVTISCTCRECIEVNTLTNSGMIAPASVPQVMISDSFHQSEPSPKSLISRKDAMNVRMMETKDVSQTSEVSGCSKLNLSALPYLARANASLMK